MPDRKQMIEHGKTVLIIFLVILAVFLLYSSGYYSGVAEKMGFIIKGGAETAKAAENEIAYSESVGQAQALEISVSARDGHRYSSMYEAEVVGEDYSRFSAFLAEALGTASAALSSDEANWIKALESEGVYIRYHAPQSVSFLAERLGTSFSGGKNVFAEEFCLCCEGETVSLYYRLDNEFYYCTTAVSHDALLGRISEYIVNSSFFSHSDKKTDGIKNSTLVIRNFSQVSEIKASSVSSAMIVEPLMAALGINEYTASNYMETGGTSVYVDGNSVTRIFSNGTASYELSGESAVMADEATLDSVLKRCWYIASQTVGASCGGAEIYLSGIENLENSSFRICFDYLMNGIPVRLGGKHAAVFEFSGRALQSLELCYRSYNLTGQSLDILPMYQAAAIASVQKCENLSLVYSDTQENIECIWVNE